MIHFRKQVGEVIYSDLLKATLKVFRLQYAKIKVENQLRQERVENKAHQHQIKNLQGEFLTVDNETDKGATTQKLLNEKKIILFNSSKIN